jgi:hypothetical protein
MTCLLVTVLLTGGTATTAQADVVDRRPTALAATAATAAMLDLETKLDDSLHVGHVVPVVFDSAEQLPGHVVSTPYWGDTELWTGVYLSGQAMRYAVAQQHLRHDNRSFWRDQRAEALARIRTVLTAFHRDINIAEDWDETFKAPPAVNTQNPLGPHTADFGGGVVHGERGMITRGCTPVGLGPMGINPPSTDPGNPVNDHANHVYEITWTSGDGNRYYCETSPSRDTYAGVTFGLLTTFDLVGQDEPALAGQIRADLLSMASFLVKYGWSFPRPNGYVATGNDENGFISPLMAHVPSARLNIANAARHVASTVADKQRWNAVWAEELATQGPLLGAEKEINSAQPSEGYFKFNLDHLTGFNLLRTTTGAERDLLARGFAVMDKTTRNDGNAHFEALTYGLTGETSRRDAAVTHLFEWLDYRQNTAGGVAVRNSARCGTGLSCVRKDRADVTLDAAPGSPVTWYPGAPDASPLSSPADLRAERPIPVALRPPGDFLWQEPPTKLDGRQPAEAREPGIDFLTPYWTVRYFSEVAPPGLAPFPEWVGPEHT